jgi:enoyl-CoA hydratase/carnithine racemase
VTTILVPAALDLETTPVLLAALTAARQTGGTVVLRGGADTFCGGMTLSVEPEDPMARRDAAHAFASCLAAIATMPAPVIAMVEGDATAGGVGLAAAADVVLATGRATFALTELLFGLVPAIIAPALFMRLSPAQVRLWTMTGERWTAYDAKRRGLTDAVVPAPDVEVTLHAWTRRLARVDRGALGEWKRLLWERSAADGASAVDVSLARMSRPDVQDALRLFQRDGTPPWRRVSS